MINESGVEISRSDVERIVRRDFSRGQVEQAISILSRYGGEDWHRSADRVHAAALKLADGSLDRLERLIVRACEDYRDILSLAENPEYLRCVDPSASISPEERQRIKAADQEQYREWFIRP